MPFQDGVYYPFTSDTQGTHSSAGIPSLLNSPLSQHSAQAMTPSSSAPAILPFRFRPRRESVDWRRISAVDINLVVNELDVDALQEHISAVTFCCLDGERCQRCRSPVDPSLVKLLQLAQLTVEWLLHCQEFLTLNLRAIEERLAAGDKEREQLQAAASKEHGQLLDRHKKQEERIKELTNELKQRKKIIRTQQSLLASSSRLSSQKCLHCGKTFLNSSFLQGHMQRRHPEEYDKQLQSDSESLFRIESLKQEIQKLKEQITQQQQALQDKVAQEKEQQSLQKDLLKELDRFKAEEMARTDRKIEDSRDGIRREMEFLYSRNIQSMNDVNQNQTLMDENKLKKQDKKWKSKLQDLKARHESEKNQLLNELSRMHSSAAEQEDSMRRLKEETARKLQEKDQIIRDQREQIKKLSSSQPTKVVQVPVLVSTPAPEPKPKRVVVEEPSSALKLDPIQELSEEDKDSSSVSERRPVGKKPEPVPEKRRRVVNKKELRRELEQALLKKLETVGVEHDQRGVKSKELKFILDKLESKRESVAKAMPEYWDQREGLVSAMEQKLGQDLSASKPRRSAQVLQIRPRSSSLPSRASQVTSTSPARHSKTPQPVPRSRTTAQPKTSTPNNRSTAMKVHTAKTPPFSSDEESEEESSESEEEQPKLQRSSGPQSRLGQVLQIRNGQSGLVHSRPPPSRFSSSTNPPQSAVTKTAVTHMESEDEEMEDDEDWSDVSELQEIDPNQLRSYRDPNASLDQRKPGKENKVADLTAKLERQSPDRSIKRPAGGVSILPQRRDEVQELSNDELEESSEWVVSSLEEKHDKFKTARSSGSLRKSLDSSSTSVWGTSTGKAPKSGLTGAGTGSTLKSSLCSLSDITDSDDSADN
ncbi:cilium assembly protein DZIP1 isoform X1 [Synchiropus splendidus]|uniref:cilium assembly protein DZIP1 isoform X1 n=2 Tax=Synchiropus splendidus TaxID=270530 RepID=UPI00237E84CB|nr:cilium assembly protein DZIP1 isoform X1 [Synchiropus splendidus]